MLIEAIMVSLISKDIQECASIVKNDFSEKFKNSNSVIVIFCQGVGFTQSTIKNTHYCRTHQNVERLRLKKEEYLRQVIIFLLKLTQN